MLKKIAAHLKFKDVCSFMTFHLPYVTQQWLDSSYDVMELPHELLGYSTKLLFFRLWRLYFLRQCFHVSLTDAYPV